jgi:hypothetical protein
LQLKNVGIFYGRLAYFKAFWSSFGIFFQAFGIFIPVLGILHQEKLGNPDFTNASRQVGVPLKPHIWLFNCLLRMFEAT